MRGRIGKQAVFLVSYCIVSLVVLFELARHRSAEAWIFGLYSLPYFACLLLVAGATLFFGLAFYRFQLKALYIILAILGTGLLCAVPIELVGQAYALFHPSYYVLAWQPDRTLGWKEVPGLRWTWTGLHWFAPDFSVPIETNSYGFRDLERETRKAEGVVRLALLGDSFVEAVQVPFEKTAGHLLERQMNSMTEASSGRLPRYEVLNFGISAFGLGQCLLTWEQYASKFQPDYTFILVAELHMKRTVTGWEEGALTPKGEKWLWIRPTFRLEKDALVRLPARDFDKFVDVQRELIRGRFRGGRMLRRMPGMFVGGFAGRLMESADALLMRLQRQFVPGASVRPSPLADEKTLLTNLRILDELGRENRMMGSQLVIVDASRYFNRGAGGVSARVARFCAEKGLGYVPLSDYLQKANQRGVSTRWTYDAHFNEAGNRIFAETMFEWMAEHRSQR